MRYPSGVSVESIEQPCDTPARALRINSATARRSATASAVCSPCL
jgi:hypothetical protein